MTTTFLAQETKAVENFLEYIAAKYADNGKSTKILDAPLGFRLQPYGVDVVRHSVSGREPERVDFVVIR